MTRLALAQESIMVTRLPTIGSSFGNELCQKPKFDDVVANPPFSYRWKPTKARGDDVRFKNYGLAPKSAADFAFLLHGFHFLKDDVRYLPTNLRTLQICS